MREERANPLVPLPLRLLSVAQTGILTTSVAVLRVLESRGLDRETLPLVAGLSLGEYTALWCAGSISFQDAPSRTIDATSEILSRR